MPRKRKVVPCNENEMMPPPSAPTAAEKSKKRLKKNEANENVVAENPIRPQSRAKCAISSLFEKAQSNESLHAKYFKELNNIYEKMEHEEFMAQFLKGLRVWIKCDESNVYASVGLSFCAKYLTLVNDGATMDTHPMLVSTFDFLLITTSPVISIRFRMCQFVNLLLSSMGAEASLDDSICDNIVKYMLEHLKDVSPVVRVQAVHALQRLQMPDDLDDDIVRSYLFHLANDPSSAVRMAIVTAIGRNLYTIPSILDRLWDIDERVRRHTYLQMSSYPVKSYKIVQRLVLLEQGLNDGSDAVRKVVTSVLVPQWLQSYQRKYIAFVSSLKLDANQQEINRFVKVTKQVLFVVFRNEPVDKLIEALPLMPHGSELEKCVPFEKLTIEIAVYWLSLIEYLQKVDMDDDAGEDPLQNVICELSTFCDYLSKFFNYMSDTETADAEEWVAQENLYKFMILIDILLTFDLGDEIGRKNLQEFIAKVLSSRMLDEQIIRKLVQCVENLIPDTNQRLQFFVDVIRHATKPAENETILSDRRISEILDSSVDPNTRIKFTQLRLNVLELREQESIARESKDYERLEKVTEELTALSDELEQMVHKFYPEQSVPRQDAKRMTEECTQQCLQIFFHAVASKRTAKLTPAICQLYKDFVHRQMESKRMVSRDWALKCGIACSMLYEQLAEDVYSRLTSQFHKHQNSFIWTTSIKGAFELIDKYGFEFFEHEPDTTVEQPDDDESEQLKQGSDIIHLFSHIMDTCEEATVARALVTGFCRLVLSGRLQSKNLVSKLVLKFFSPATDTEVQQTLAIFFQTLIKRKQQECLAKVLVPTLFVILNAPIGSPLQEVKPDQVIKFVVDSTKPSHSSFGLNVHNDIALTFLNVMNENSDNKELLKLLSKELLTLEVGDYASLRNDLKAICDSLLDRPLESRTKTNIESFKDILEGTNRGAGVRTTVLSELNEINEEDESVAGGENNGQNAMVRGNETVRNGPKGPAMVISTQNTAASSTSVESNEVLNSTNSSIRSRISYDSDRSKTPEHPNSSLELNESTEQMTSRTNNRSSHAFVKLGANDILNHHNGSSSSNGSRKSTGKDKENRVERGRQQSNTSTSPSDEQSFSDASSARPNKEASKNRANKSHSTSDTDVQNGSSAPVTFRMALRKRTK